MKGVNEIVLNDATMIEAVEEYLAKRTVNLKLKVKSIVYSNSKFSVRVEESDPDAEGPKTFID